MPKIAAEVLGCPGYTALESGIILNPKGVELRQWQETPGGAFRVRIGGRNRMVSEVILTSFTGESPPGYFVKYRDGDKSNSHRENLMWGGWPRE